MNRWEKVGLVLLAWGVVSLAMVGVSGPLTGSGAVHFRTGLSVFRWGAQLGLGGACLGFLVVVGAGMAKSRRAMAFAAVGAVLSLAAFLPGVRFRQQASAVPPIHDITTDPADPPAFVAVVPLRGPGTNPVEPDPATVDAQRAAYPDLAPVVLPVGKAEAFARALAAAKSLGWEIVDADEAEGRIEATDTTPFFRFKDDVVIRVREAEPGTSRVDVRSLSRVGKSDVGANAARIRRYTAALKS